MFTSTFSDPDFREAFADLATSTETKIEQLLRVVGTEVIAYLRTLTGELRPPWPSRDGPNRPAHPGHWADRTGALAGAYGFDVTKTMDGFVLALYNTMEYAVYLEARLGFFILRGVTEQGGPVQKAIYDTVAIVAPGWTIVTLDWSAS